MKALAVLALIGAALLLYGLAEARRDPVVRRIALPLSDWPAGAPPVRAVLLSDIHFGSITMGPERLARIVDRVTALKPDIVLIAGDFIAGHDPATAAAVAPQLAAGLSRLRAPLGVVAVLGNHDYATDPAAVRRALIAANIRVLANQAIRRGPLAIGGVDDQLTGHDDLPRTVAAVARLGGAAILMAHGPDALRKLRHPATAKQIPAKGPQVLLAGHTHCGQITLPGIGSIGTVIDPREIYLCGASRQARDRLVVTAGLGTSILPIRIGAPPDLWLIAFGPATQEINRPRS